ncbi:MAG: hypothetical protein KIH64_008820 [Mycobacterium sp.]|nr:hypothetical protein [Mycobacterium sp.]
MTNHSPEQIQSARHTNRWPWFLGILGGLSLIGAGVAFVAMLPLGMATDPCHGDGGPDRVCRLTAAGQNLLVMIPWIVLIGALASALVSAAVLAKRRISPLYGLIFWVIGGVLTAVVANEIAYLI